MFSIKKARRSAKDEPTERMRRWVERDAKRQPRVWDRWDPIRRRRLHKALKVFSDALVLSPDNASAKHALGRIHQGLGDHERALEWFEAAHAADPSNIDICREASLSAVLLRRFDPALAYCRRCIGLAPQDPGLHANMAVALLLLGRDAAAADAVARAVQLAPEDPMNRRLSELVRDVAEGARPRPVTLDQL